MRPAPNERIETGRLTHDERFATPVGVRYGAFQFNFNGTDLRVISSGVDTEHGWEHVSVSAELRCPNWNEMCFIKDLFWDEEETVVQFHPKKSRYVNNHPHCLHLWRSLNGETQLPPKELI